MQPLRSELYHIPKQFSEDELIYIKTIFPFANEELLKQRLNILLQGNQYGFVLLWSFSQV